MQIGMAHYKRMEKPDRDRDEALEAEGAFQTFLQKYPSSPLYKDAQQRLREVQEVLAEGDFGVAQFYYMRKADRAAAARLTELVNRYPLFSQADRANWMLATIYERTEHNDIAAQYYARIVKDYPLSPLADDAKARAAKVRHARCRNPIRRPWRAWKRSNRSRGQRITWSPGRWAHSSPDPTSGWRRRWAHRILTPEDNAPTDTLIPGGTGNTDRRHGDGGRNRIDIRLQHSGGNC